MMIIGVNLNDFCALAHGSGGMAHSLFRIPSAGFYACPWYESLTGAHFLISVVQIMAIGREKQVSTVAIKGIFLCLNIEINAINCTEFKLRRL